MTSQLSRRTILAAPLGVAGIVASSRSAEAATAVVDMEKLVLAAQLDPVKSGNGITVGAKESVLEVEKALADLGYLQKDNVDGHYGTRTVAAYRNWQESLGYRGLAANGIPGAESLKRLASDKFTIQRQLVPGRKTTIQRYPINQRTLDMLRESERLFGLRFTVEQGSYSPDVDSTSAGTHDGGGVLDLDSEAFEPAQKQRALVAMRRVGFAAWLRTPRQGDWPEHFHVVAISDTDMSPSAQSQVGRYYLGRNGLANNEPDDGPAIQKVTWEDYRRQGPS